MLEEFDILNVKDKFREIILKEYREDYFKKLFKVLNIEYKKFKIFPRADQVFNAFKYKDFDEIKVVILGQDPYHKENQANGLSFSVNMGEKIPISLRNIFKEMRDDIGCNIPLHGDLTSWADQGVLLLNSVLTVREGQANSHKLIGWDVFTDKIIKHLSDERENLVFILWGNLSIKKEILININKHLILKSPHPSGLSAYRGFFSSKPFSTTNRYLKNKFLGEINWEIN